MRIVKKILIGIGIIIGVIIGFLLLDYFVLNISYNMDKYKYEEMFDVQGNKDKYVPQGMTYSKKYNVVLQTSYSGNNDVSMLYVIDFSSGKLLKSLKLRNTKGKDDKTHVGGIATDDSTVWITSDYYVKEYLLDDIMSTSNDYVQSKADTKLGIRGDFCYYGYNTLYIGDFCLAPFYKVPDNNPLLLAFDTETDYNYDEPKYIMSLPKMVQGMTIAPNKSFVFTCSFTNLIKSDLKVYSNVLEEKAETYNYKGKDVPYYKFTNNNNIVTIKFPPMAEGLFSIDNDLYMLFESSSDKYFYAIPKMKKVIKYTLK
ncbi:MAG: hypothetical protein IKE91_03020 [Clostridia bacterium]|nr:hypothetical protein [Clostridia bacterium]